MPMYEYRCRECGREYEQLRRMSEAEKDLECPACASREVELKVSGFAMAGCGSGGGGRFT